MDYHQDVHTIHPPGILEDQTKEGPLQPGVEGAKTLCTVPQSGTDDGSLHVTLSKDT